MIVCYYDSEESRSSMTEADEARIWVRRLSKTIVQAMDLRAKQQGMSRDEMLRLILEDEFKDEEGVVIEAMKRAYGGKEA